MVWWRDGRRCRPLALRRGSVLARGIELLGVPGRAWIARSSALGVGEGERVGSSVGERGEGQGEGGFNLDYVTSGTICLCCGTSPSATGPWRERTGLYGQRPGALRHAELLDSDSLVAQGL